MSDVKAAAREKNLHKIGPCLLRKFQMLRGLDAFNDGLSTEAMRQVHHAGEKIRSAIAVRGPVDKSLVP